jgi:hypothetical protein
VPLNGIGLAFFSISSLGVGNHTIAAFQSAGPRKRGVFPLVTSASLGGAIGRVDCFTNSRAWHDRSVLDGPLYAILAARARSAVLLRLDALLSGGGASYDYPSVTVEHVLPQTPAEGSWWMTWFPSAEERAAWVNRVGNLALLTRKKNSSASNYEFYTKKTAYFTKGGVSPFALTTQVLQYQEWTPIVVSNRQKQILATFTDYWRLA